MIQHFFLVSFHRFQNFQFFSVFVRYKLIVFVLFSQKFQRQNILRETFFFFKLLFLANRIMYYYSLYIPGLPSGTHIESNDFVRCFVLLWSMVFSLWEKTINYNLRFQFSENFTSRAVRDRRHVHGVMYQKISDFFSYKFSSFLPLQFFRRRIKAAEMKLFRPLAGNTLYDHKTNDYIRRELWITGILDKIDEYRRNWLSHLQRMPQNRIPLKYYHYRSQGRRTIGSPKKRWRDQL